MRHNMFCSEVELGKLLGSIEIIPYAIHAISKTSSTYEIHKSPSGIQVLAFNCSSDYTTRFQEGEFGLVSSKYHKTVDFISSGLKVNPSFCINKAAVALFEHLPEGLKQLKDELISSPLVITGQNLGGYSAILFALWLHHEVDKKQSNDNWDSKRPICITFGSPLVGDGALQSIISEESPQWKSRFLNVVAKNDRVASLFSSNSGYKPFGTFLFCTESGGHSAFENQESILAVLDIMSSSSAENNQNMEIQDYGKLFTAIRKKALYQGVPESCDFNVNSLRAGIKSQFREAGMLDNKYNELIVRMEENLATMIKNKVNAYEPTKKLNDMKLKLTYVELYMKISETIGGYYDCYKNPKNRDEERRKIEIIGHKRALNQYWELFVKETDRKPQSEDAKMRKRWLLSGHNYRRIIEPLDIAQFYAKDGNRNYIANRSDHYKKLEELLTKSKKDINSSEGNKKATSLTEDSCFWARLEEALISLHELSRNGGLSNIIVDEMEKNLKEFEADLMHAINSYLVSPDIFIKDCSLMKWWNEYKAYKGTSYASEFANYMNSMSYESYK